MIHLRTPGWANCLLILKLFLGKSLGMILWESLGMEAFVCFTDLSCFPGSQLPWILYAIHLFIPSALTSLRMFHFELESFPHLQLLSPLFLLNTG